MQKEKKHNFQDLLEIMARLRSPDGGCPWDLKQTHESILKCLIEESYEYIEAVTKGDKENMAEELGDVLLQVVFHSQMALEAGDFSIDEVIHQLTAKLIRRHPHVFGGAQADSPEEVHKNWEAIKAEEKKSKEMERTLSVLDGIPENLPPLIKAEKIQKKAKKVGFEWPDYRGPLAKVKEELLELEEEIEKKGSQNRPQKMQEEAGDLLFSVVNLCRHLEVDPFLALCKTNQKFSDRFQLMEKLVEKRGKSLKGLSLGEMDEYWERAKTSLKRPKNES